MSDNLNLPICPKCNDTKHVSQKESTKMYQVNYYCESCLFDWNTLDYTIDSHSSQFTKNMISLIKIVIKRNEQ